MKRIEPHTTELEAATKVWSIADYVERHQLSETEERSLKLLFGTFATAFELQHNVTHKPRWR
jgi:hypothetical protein